MPTREASSMRINQKLRTTASQMKIAISEAFEKEETTAYAAHEEHEVAYGPYREGMGDVAESLAREAV
jgi:hypothetical protein